MLAGMLPRNRNILFTYWRERERIRERIGPLKVTDRRILKARIHRICGIGTELS
jgi:hypothetical protein